MNQVLSSEYEYVRALVFFGFMCGITFSALVAVLVHIFHGHLSDKHKSLGISNG